MMDYEPNQLRDKLLSQLPEGIKIEMPATYLESTMLPNTITTHFDLAAGLINRPQPSQRTQGAADSPQKTQYSSNSFNY